MSTGSTEYETVEYAVSDDHVATITLNRPARMNSFTETMANEMVDIWNRIKLDDAVHVAVLRAAGDRAFCTGIDISEGGWWMDRSIFHHLDPGEMLGPKQHRLWKPVVAAVHGMAAGGAMYFLNECDIIICSDDASFFDPHANAGIVSALEPIGMLKRGMQLGDVMRWALMGTEERIGAKTAKQIGLVSEVVPRAELHTRADEIATHIAGRRPDAIQGTVRAIWEAVDMTRHTALQNGLAYTHIGNPTPEEFMNQTHRQSNLEPRTR